jgi:hypothetical protein
MAVIQDLMNFVPSWQKHINESGYLKAPGQTDYHQKAGYNFKENFPNTPEYVADALGKAYQYGTEGVGSFFNDDTFSDAKDRAKEESRLNSLGFRGQGFNMDEYNQTMNFARNGFDPNTGLTYGAAQAGEMPGIPGANSLERDFPGMSTGDIIDSMNNRAFIGRQISPMAKPQIASPRTVIDPNRIPGRIQEAVEPSTRFRDASNMAEYLQGNPQIMDNIQNTIGSGIDKFKSGLGSIKDFAMDKGRMGKNLLGSAGAMAMGLPGMVGSGVMSLLSGLGNGADYQKYTPGFNYNGLNDSMINDFFDPATGLNRFDRARKKGNTFASARTGAEYFKARREKKAAMQQQIKDAAAERASYMARAQRTADSRDSGQGNTVTGFGKSGLGRDPNDRMADGGRVGLASMFTRRR